MKSQKCFFLFVLTAFLFVAVSCNVDALTNGGNQGDADNTGSGLTIEQYKKMWKSYDEVTENDTTELRVDDGNIIFYGDSDQNEANEYKNGILSKKTYTWNGGSYTVKEYDEHGNEESETYFNENGEQQYSKTKTNTYKDGKLTKAESSDGSYELYEYNDKGFLAKEERYSSSGELQATLTYQYDGVFLIERNGLNPLDFVGTFIQFRDYGNERKGFKYEASEYCYNAFPFYVYLNEPTTMRNMKYYSYDFDRESWYLSRDSYWNEEKSEYIINNYDYDENTGESSINEDETIIETFKKNDDGTYTLTSKYGTSETYTSTFTLL